MNQHPAHYVPESTLAGILAGVRADLAAHDIADRKTHQLGTAPKFNRPAQWRPYVAAVMADNLFVAPAGW